MNVVTISSWLNFGHPAPPGRGLQWGEFFWLLSTASAQCLRLWALFHQLCFDEFLTWLSASDTENSAEVVSNPPTMTTNTNSPVQSRSLASTPSVRFLTRPDLFTLIQNNEVRWNVVLYLIIRDYSIHDLPPVLWGDHLHKVQTKECLWFSWFMVSFHCSVVCLSCFRAPRDIFHTPVAQCSLFIFIFIVWLQFVNHLLNYYLFTYLLLLIYLLMLKVLLNNNKPNQKGKGKASSLDIAPLTILNSGTLQPWKWQLTGNDCSTAAHAVAAQSLR